MKEILTLFLKALSSVGVKESALPMTGITLTRGDRRLMSSISISLRLYKGGREEANVRANHSRVPNAKHYERKTDTHA